MTLGFGAIDTGQPDALENCGPLPDDVFRCGPDGTVTYQFDRLLRARFYHLDVVLRDCVSGNNRLQSVEVNGSLLATGIDPNDGKAHYLSFLLDPKLYDDRTITVKVSATGGQGGIVSRVTLKEILYRHVDAGLTAGTDTPWNVARGYGWLATYNVNTSCGPLPYQTARVNQSGNTLQYRFDGLDPAKRYKVVLSLYQCTGSGVIQRQDIDGNVVGADLVAQSGSLLAVMRKVPQTSYQADGSIVVSIIRTNSSANAMIGEVILEEETLAAAPVCEGLVRFTPYNTHAFGDVFINGILASLGTLVTAENPRGDTVGCYVVKTEGDYGFMKIYGEDALSNPPTPGMRAGEPVRFRVDGVAAVGMPLLQWRGDSDCVNQLQKLRSLSNTAGSCENFVALLLRELP